jgi:arsenite methyltransferase
MITGGGRPVDAGPSEDDDGERRTRVDYGIDAWRTVVWLGFAACAAGFVMLFAAIAHAPGWLSLGAFTTCTLLGLAALAFVWSSKVGKMRERVRLADWLALPTDAYVLDAGCGTGAVLVELARRTPGGLAVGVDVWQIELNEPLGPEVPLSNAELEGVDEHVDVMTASVTALPFADGVFDAVSCTLVLRTLPGPDARLAAIREAARVLAPGGRLVVLETGRTRALTIAMRSVDLADVTRSRRVWRLLPPARYVAGRKPPSS